MTAMELYDILTLEDDKDYLIANMVDYNDSTYLYLMEVDKNEEVIEENQLIVRRVVHEGEESVVKVTNDEEYKTVAKLFFDLFKDLALENLEESSSDNSGK